MLPPAPVSMYTVPATLVTLISTLLKSCLGEERRGGESGENDDPFTHGAGL